jgi:hypothetical protein
MAAQLIIKSHSPWKLWLKWVSLLGAFIFVGWFSYRYGIMTAGQVNIALQQEQQRLQQKVFELGRDNVSLREQQAVMQRSAQVDKEAYVEINQNLKDLQNELLELKQEVAFYRGIVTPSEAASGLNITSLKFDSIGDANGYRFKLILTQVMKNERIVRGNAKIFIDGLMQGQQRQLNLSEVSGGKLSNLELRFKYFQNIEGDIVLPDGFVPSSVLVDLKPRGRGKTRIKKSFDWSDITS